MANVRTARKSGFIVRNGVSRRETVWFSIDHASVTLAASGTAALRSTMNAAALALWPFTVVRTRMRWLVISDQSAATESFIGNLGFAVVSDQAVGVGIAAIPTPATDLGSDLWYVIEQWEGQFDFIGTGTANQSLQDREIDSKAMRKVDVGQDIAITVEAGIGGTGCVLKSVGRMLVKLH